MYLDLLAHSGATIGLRGPTNDRRDRRRSAWDPMLEQVLTYPGNPDDAAVIVINGGVNDVNVRFIINPLTRLEDLEHKTHRYCYEDMLALWDERGVSWPTF